MLCSNSPLACIDVIYCCWLEGWQFGLLVGWVVWPPLFNRNTRVRGSHRTRRWCCRPEGLSDRIGGTTGAPSPRSKGMPKESAARKASELPLTVSARRLPTHG